MNDPRYALTAENILKVTPDILKSDEGVAGFLEATAQIFEELSADVTLANMYSAVDKLPESLLDILAVDFKIDWWDPELSVEEKRRVFRDNWKVHRTIGTVGAVEKAISAIYPRTTVEEWFTYGGEPYHFRLKIDITDDSVDSDRMRRVLDRLRYYKNLRSHNDMVKYLTALDAEPHMVARVARTGYIAGMHVDVESAPPERPVYHVTQQARYGAGRMMGVMHVDVKE